VFNDLNDHDGNDSSDSSLDENELMNSRQAGAAVATEQAAKYNKLRDPAYPASHPVNAQEFDP